MNFQNIQQSGDNFQESINAVLSLLDARSKDVLMRRYGIKNNLTETLDSIGKEYGITRERVRQIESQAKKLLAKRQEVLSDVAIVLEQIFSEHGGALAEQYLMDIINDQIEKSPKVSLVRFYLDVLPPYQFVSRSIYFAPHWVHPELVTKHAESVISTAESILKELREPISEFDLIEKIRMATGIEINDLSDKAICALLKASKKLKKTVFHEWSLATWVDATPRGVSDKSYIILKRHKKPLHFRDITKLINDVKFDYKRAHEQTVHNELIKDERFVLVGRGLYALTDWGYIPGTVADVLEAILNQASGPLTRDELLEKVLQQRMVKKTTVLLGLQNSNRFKRVEGDRYSLNNK